MALERGTQASVIVIKTDRSLMASLEFQLHSYLTRGFRCKQLEDSVSMLLDKISVSWINSREEREMDKQILPVPVRGPMEALVLLVLIEQ